MLLNLLQLLQSDDQQTYTDKVNYNFDQILSMGGGPIGPTGFQGIQGVPGAQGIQGFQGIPGINGTKWYVQPSTSTPTIPVPALGDLWLQTDTLHVFEFVGSPPSWIDTGNILASTGVFTSGGANNLLFTNPSPLRSLVLSPISYGIGNDSPGAVDYRMKIVTSSGSPMIRFAVDDGGAESTPTTTQPTISVQKINDALYPNLTNWRLNVDDLNGDIFLNLNGNYLGIYPQIASVSRFDFGAQTRIQNNATDRVLSFAVSNTGTEFFHIGRHTAITNTPDRLFSIKDNGQIAIGDAFSNPVGATNYHIDSINDDLAPAGSPVDWLRLRGRVNTSGTTYDSLNIFHNRLFVDPGPIYQRSTMIRMQHQVNNAFYHFVGFTGGADAATAVLRPQLRLGYGNGYYLAADLNGRIGLGNTTFIQKYNSLGNFFQPRLTVQGESILSVAGGSSHSGIHLIPQNTVNAVVGLTSGGIGLYENTTFAGIHFQDQSSAIDQGVDLNFSTGLYTDGGETRRRTILRNGDHYWWSKISPATAFMYLEPGTWNGRALNVMTWGAFDNATNLWQDLIFNIDANYTNYGNGFIGLGGAQGFGEPITGSTPLTLSGQQYIALTTCAVTFTPFIGFPFSQIYGVNDIITASTFPDTCNLDFGTVARAKPQTKLHVNALDAVTFGTRLDGTYSGNVGAMSFTVGNNHKASGLRSIVMGGSGHQANGTDGIIIGYSGVPITFPDANKVLLATTTHVNTSAPTTLLSSSIYTAGDAAGFGSLAAQYNVTGGQILQASTAIQTNGFFLLGEIGRYASVLTLEGRTDNSQLTGVRVGMEYHIKNSSNTKRLIASISGEYSEPSAGTPRGTISFAVCAGPAINGTGVGSGGALAEVLRLSTSGLMFIATDTSMKAKVTVQQNQKASGAGVGLFLTGGDANTTGAAAAGGNINVDAGRGYLGGANGGIGIGTIIGGPIDIGTTGGFFGPTTRITLNAPVTAASGVMRADVDFTTGTDTPGWVSVVPTNADLVYYDPNANNGAWALTGSSNFIKYKIIGKTCIMHVQMTGTFSDANLPYTHAMGWILPAGIVPKYEPGLNQTIEVGFGRASGTGSVRTLSVTCLNPIGAGQWRRGPGSTTFNANAIVGEDLQGGSLSPATWTYKFSLVFEIV